MATVSADLGRLDAFVAAANEILTGDGGLTGQATSGRVGYDAFQALQGSHYGVRNADLMGMGGVGGEVQRFISNLERDRLFVQSVKLALERASGQRGVPVVVDQAAFDREFPRAARETFNDPNVDLPALLTPRSAITVNGTEVGVVPRTSGFVNDPICTATGHFLEVEDDFTWPERVGVLRWRRMYSSQLVAEGPFGRGWASWASVGLVRHDSGAVGYQGPEGQLVVFLPDPLGVGFRRVWGVAGRLRVVEGGNGAGGNGAGGGGWELVWDWESPHPGEVWRFDGEGRLRVVSGPVTGRTEFEYDAVSRHLVAVRHDSGRGLELEWDGPRVVRVRSSCGREARYFYDQAGDLVRSERVLGDRDYVVDGLGRIVEVVDADGVRLCHNTYDDEGRVVAQVSPFGRETRLAYRPGNRTVVSDGEGGPVSVYEHDEAGRLTGLVDHDGHRMQRVFDPLGRCVAVTAFDGSVVRQSYASDGRSASLAGPSGVAERWEYDDQHRVTSHEVEGGATLAFDYEGDGVVPSAISAPDGWGMRLGAEGGLLRSLTDADGVSVSIDYDQDGNAVAVTNGLGAVTRVDPHVSGEPSRLTLPDGSSFEFGRDDGGRLLEVVTPTGDRFGMEWTPAGRLAAMVEPNGARTIFESGSHGEVERVTDALGGVLELQRDQLARLVGMAAPGGAKWCFEYTALGLLSMVTDPAGAVWHYDYDPDGRLVAATDPLGHSARQRYNPAGRLVEFLDRSGSATRYSHDALGRVISQTDPEGAVTAYGWDTWGRPTSVRLPDGDTLSYSYTPAGRVASVETAEGRRWSNSYDAGGRLVAVTDAQGATTRFEWDACDRMVAMTRPSGRVERYRYDSCGRTVEVERGGQVWRTGYDHAGRVVSTTDPLGSLTRYEYDPAGKLVAATDPVGNTVRFRYDERGNISGVVDPFGGLVTTSYDAMRRPIAVTDQLGRTTRIDRDASGRPVRQELPTGEIIEWRRDPRGQTSDVRVGGRDAIVFHRDRTGRPLLIHEPARNRTLTLDWTAGGRLRSLDVDGAEMRWDYDGDGFVAARHDPAGRTTRYARDRVGRLSGVSIDGWGRIELERDADGRLAALRAPGFHRQWEHDTAGLIVTAHTSGDGDADGAVGLVRDAAGRVVERRDSSGTTRYRYDPAGQLVAAARDSEAWLWDYDPAGRLAREQGPHGVRSFSYDDAHQLVAIDGPHGRTDYTYDAAGRRTEERGPDHTRRYTWDRLGRLAGVDVDGRRHTLDVDALGRLAGVDDVPLLWDPTTPIAEVLTIGDQRIIGAGSLTLGVTDADGATQWLAGEGRGSTERGDGRDPWGCGSGADADSPSLGYLGEVEIDGLLWLRNRVYDPETRQFLSPDPLAGVPGLPVAANPYAYANNDPIGFVDPLGLQGQPLSIEDYNAYRRQNYGVNWGNIVTAVAIVASVALAFTGVGLVASIALGAVIGGLAGAAPGVIQGIQDHGWNMSQWDWAGIGGGALKGAIIGAAGGGLAGGLGSLGTRVLPAALTTGSRTAATAFGGGVGALSGAGGSTLGEFYDLTPLPGSDGQFNGESVVLGTVLGGATGAGVSGARYTPAPGRLDVYSATGDDSVVAANARPANMTIEQARAAAESYGVDTRPLDLVHRTEGMPGYWDRSYGSTPMHMNPRTLQETGPFRSPDGRYIVELQNAALQDPQTAAMTIKHEVQHIRQWQHGEPMNEADAERAAELMVQHGR